MSQNPASVVDIIELEHLVLALRKGYALGLGSQLIKVNCRNNILFNEPKLNKCQLSEMELIAH